MLTISHLVLAVLLVIAAGALLLWLATRRTPGPRDDDAPDQAGQRAGGRGEE
jgi:hypothetical protein